LLITDEKLNSHDRLKFLPTFFYRREDIPLFEKEGPAMTPLSLPLRAASLFRSKTVMSVLFYGSSFQLGRSRLHPAIPIFFSQSKLCIPEFAMLIKELPKPASICPYNDEPVVLPPTLP
jgi:hypothetical protein